jgi:hypothetical protein
VVETEREVPILDEELVLTTLLDVEALTPETENMLK